MKQFIKNVSFFTKMLIAKVHRRLLRDDAFGVGEALDEVAFGNGLIARGSSYFVFGSKKHTEKTSTEAIERFVQLETLLPSWLLFSNVSHLSSVTWINNYNHIVSFFYINEVNKFLSMR